MGIVCWDTRLGFGSAQSRSHGTGHACTRAMRVMALTRVTTDLVCVYRRKSGLIIVGDSMAGQLFRSAECGLSRFRVPKVADCKVNALPLGGCAAMALHAAIDVDYPPPHHHHPASE